MDEHFPTVLQHGDLGKPQYNAATQSWFFSRTLTDAPPITYAGSTKVSVKSPLTTPQSFLIQNRSLISQLFPELAACLPIDGNENVSHGLMTTCGKCDPLVSSLFDLGYAVDVENDDSGSRAIPIAVVTSGECGNTLSLRKIEDDIVDLKQEVNTSVRVPAIGQTESVEWSADGAPVRQITFARALEEKSTWMAARFPRFTTIFRPEYHRKPVPIHMNKEHNRVNLGRSASSRLDANPLVEISNSQTGGFAHADVTFNPWYQKQLGIVDERGNWSIWEVSGRHKLKKSNWIAEPIKSGSLPWVHLGRSPETHNGPRYDGWATVEWIADFNSIIVSDRRCSILYRTEGSRAYPSLIELDLQRKSEWILCVKRSSYNASHVFILTTCRVFWLEIAPGPVSTKDGGSRSIRPTLSWYHCRDPEDTTLQFTQLLMHEDFYIFLHSRLNDLAVAFPFPVAPEANMDTLSIPDPFVIDVAPILENAEESKVYPNSTHTTSLMFREVTHLPSCVGKHSYNSNTRLAKLFAMDSRLSVRESIFIGSKSSDDANELARREDIIRLNRRFAGRHTANSMRSLDGFIVDDFDQSALGPRTFLASTTGTPNIKPLAVPQWTIDYAQMYAVATGSTSSYKDQNDRPPEMCFRESIAYLETRLVDDGLWTVQSVSQTMGEVLQKSPLLDDIDQNAREVQGFLSKIAFYVPKTQERGGIVNYKGPFARALSREAEHPGKPPLDLNLIETYDWLLNSWIGTLPHGIPSRTRIMKERIIRTVTADIILAQITTTTRKVGYALDKSYGQDSSYSSKASWLNWSQDTHTFHDPQLPTSIPASDNSEIPVQSAASPINPSSGENSRGAYIKSVYSSLPFYTMFFGGLSLPQKAANILQHWDTGADPAAHNWQGTAQAFDIETLQRASQATTPPRRLRRKTSQSGANMVLSQVPSTAPFASKWGSQPVNNETSDSMIQPQSSQILDENLPMTQMERGAFGGRESGRKNALKARKKKRAAGF